MKRIVLAIVLLLISLASLSQNYYGVVKDATDKELIRHQVTIKPDAIYILTYPATIYKLYNVSNTMRNGYGYKQIMAETKSKQTVRIVFVELPSLNNIIIYIDDKFLNIETYNNN